MDLDNLRRFELARADLIGTPPLCPEQIRALARHIEALDADDLDWQDRLAGRWTCISTRDDSLFAAHQLRLELASRTGPPPVR